MALTYEDKLAMIRDQKIKAGDKWRNIKSGRVVEILECLPHRDLKLRHQDGRETRKGDYYFAYDYEPVDQAEVVPTKQAIGIAQAIQADLIRKGVSALPSKQFLNLLAKAITPHLQESK